MKVKVGESVFDAEIEPVMVILTEADKANIANMPRNKTKYCGFPAGTDLKWIGRWMERLDVRSH